MQPVRSLGLGLMALVMVSAIAIVYVRHQHRLTFIALQEAQAERDRLNMEWRQLLVEESTWSGHHLVEKSARRKLQMMVPVAVDTIDLEDRQQ